MSITTTCPSCRKPLRASDDWAGKAGQCPACQAAVTFPAATALPQIDTTTHQPAASRRRNNATPVVVVYDMPLADMIVFSLKWIVANMIATAIIVLPLAVLAAILMALSLAARR